MSSVVLHTDPRDGLTHAWVTPADDEWWSLCGLAADPATLTEPTNDATHIECMLALGTVAEGRLPGIEWTP